MSTVSKSTESSIGLLGRMVWENRPWRLVPHLAGAAAAATGTAAYVVITSTFWSMGDALPPWRLGLINIIAIGAMATWLLLRNNLWGKSRKRSHRKKVALYNASTMATLFLGVACMYVILYIITLFAALVIIDSNYLSSRLGHSSSFWNYVAIVWLATSVGIVAGALGSSFESEEAVRKATYSKKELERQQSSER